MKRKILSLLTGFLCFNLVSCNSSEESSSSVVEPLQVLPFENLLLAPNEAYYFVDIVDEQYFSNARFECQNNEIAFIDKGYITGKTIGDTTIKVYVNDVVRQEVAVSVKDENYVREHLSLDKGRLYQKKAVFFGDSITDTNHRPSAKDNSLYGETYEYWPEILRDSVPMTTANHAYSGATAAYNTTVNMGDSFTNYGPQQVDKASKELPSADYVFIFIGTNDFMRSVPLGTIDDNPTNYKDATTFNGAYNLMVNKIRELNTTCRIVCFSTSWSTWGNFADGNSYPLTREDYSNTIKNLCEKHHMRYVDIYGLFNEDNWQNMIPDGIHPAREGQQLIADTVLNVK